MLAGHRGIAIYSRAVHWLIWMRSPRKRTLFVNRKRK